MGEWADYWHGDEKIAETAEAVLTRVLDEHEYATGPNRMGCMCRWTLPKSIETSNQEAHRAHVAAELAAALREAGLLVEGETVTEWGVEFRDGSVKHIGEFDSADDFRAFLSQAPQLLGMTAMSRQRTRYPDHVTDWQPVEDGGGDA